MPTRHHPTELSYRIIVIRRNVRDDGKGRNETNYTDIIPLDYDPECGVERGVWFDGELRKYVSGHDTVARDFMLDIIYRAIMMGPLTRKDYATIVAEYDSPERTAIIRSTEERKAERMLEYFRHNGLKYPDP